MRLFRDNGVSRVSESNAKTNWNVQNTPYHIGRITISDYVAKAPGKMRHTFWKNYRAAESPQIKVLTDLSILFGGKSRIKFKVKLFYGKLRLGLGNICSMLSSQDELGLKVKCFEIVFQINLNQMAKKLRVLSLSLFLLISRLNFAVLPILWRLETFFTDWSSSLIQTEAPDQ